MAKLDIIDRSGQPAGQMDLPESVFAGRPNDHLIYEAVVNYRANQRQGTAATKTRAFVSGGGKKPWRQKGTGRARVGEIRNPLWRKGGTVFGPQPRSYDYALPKKVQRGALRAALAAKFKDGAVIVVDALEFGEVKTKQAAETLKRLGASGKTLVVDVQPNENAERSTRNLANVRLVPSGRLTARDVMDTKRIIATRAAVERLQEVLG